jgi:hypothetical protein
MTNHIHLFMQVSDVPLGRVMLRIASMYARRVQMHLATTGHLFERRHDPVLVDTDEYLITLLRYVHLNPVRAGMVKSPDDYPWSSHAAYAGGAAPSWLTTDFAKRLLHSDSARAEDMYRRMMECELLNASPTPFDQLNPADRRVLGGDTFLAHVQGLSWRPQSRENIEDVIAKFCVNDGIAVGDLCTNSRRRELARLRAQIAEYCLDRRIASLSEVARRFGRDESSLRKWILRNTESK